MPFRRAVHALRALALVWSALSALIALCVFVMIRERYGRRGPIPVSQAHQLLSPARRWLHAPAATLMRFFRVNAGDTVLEIGPGPGYFTIDAARAAGPSGRVVSIDIQPGMLSVLRDRLGEQHIENARPVAADAGRLLLAAGSIDVAFLVFVLGEIPDRPRALAELRRVLKPGGTLAVMEGMNDPDYQLEASVVDLCRAVGFEEVDRQRQRLGYARCFRAPALSEAP